MENQNNQTQNQTMEQQNQNKGFFEQFKNMSFGGYLCICAVLKVVVEIAKLVCKAIEKK